jgi:hypothetical protein
MKNIRPKKPKKLNKKANKSNTIKEKKVKKKTVQSRIKKDKEKFLDIFRENIAIITTSCLKAKINRSTYYDWCKTDKEFKKKIEEIREEQLSQVEDRLLKAILNDNIKGIIFYLQSKHPDYKRKTGIDFKTEDKIITVTIIDE